jgi:DMSO/TMAO reductase YedYZ molybdopterin-dependent catalytic subunit
VTTTRRTVLHTAVAAAAWAATRAAAQAGPRIGPAGLPEGALESATWDTLPGKVPLIKRTWRPANYETPVRLLSELYTPNDAFFVRWHLANIPRVESVDDWRLTIGGDAAKAPLTVSLADLQRDFERVELAAVCLCSGQRRGLSQPHVPGVQWGHGAIGNARWTGVRLKDVLARAGLAADAVEVQFDGGDTGVAPATPDFVKSLPVWKATDPDVLIAWAMNGEALPHWNGFPVRLVVPGWTATYWIKQLVRIDVLRAPSQSFWMRTGYRIPKGRFPIVERFASQETEQNQPITEMVVNSLIVNLTDGLRVRARSPLFVRGFAWDGGYGIARVDVSHDAGVTWTAAELGPDVGRFSWRPWAFAFSPEPGEHVVMARATNRLGATQTFELVFNPAGYHNNVVQSVRVVAT